MASNYSEGADRRQGRIFGLVAAVPGLALTALLAILSYTPHLMPFGGVLSPMLVAMLLGILGRNAVGIPTACQPGITVATRHLLRTGIVLLGFQLTLGDLIAFGPSTILMLALVVAGTLFFTLWLGRTLRVEPSLTQLIAMGTAICGASAIVASNAVAKASNEDVAYAMICITLFGTASMLAYPVLSALIGLDAHHFAIWTGASIHEVAQVVGASFQWGEATGQSATVVKLGRVLMLAPLLLTLGAVVARGANSREATSFSGAVPGFVLLFIALIALNSLVDIPSELRSAGVTTSGVLMTMALAGLGLNANFALLRLKGIRPLVLGGMSTLFVSVIALALTVAMT